MAKLEVIDCKPARVHICSVCKKRDKWRRDWQWYGSLKDLDDDVPILKFCSKKCKVLYNAA